MKTPASLKNKVAIVGVGESEIGRVPHMSGLGLNAQAARRALDDAGLKMSEIDGLITAYSFTEPYFMLGSVLCEYLGVKPRLNASMVVGGASPAVMLKHAADAIVAGQAQTILVCAGENRATGQTRDAAVASLLAVGHPYFEQPYGGSIPGYYAMIAQRHMHVYGTTREQLAQVAVHTREHAALHPSAHMRKPVTLDEVLSAKPIADPFGMLDCCLISDAGGAFVVTSAERARDLKAKPVYLQGIGEYHTHEHLMCAPSLTKFGATESGRIAYEMAGLGPPDIDVAQLYDCSDHRARRAGTVRARRRRCVLCRGAQSNRRQTSCEYAWRDVVACSCRRGRRPVRHR
jgi:acetyl-CoA acetyltransferase